MTEQIFKTKYPLKAVLPIAENLLGLLKPHCIKAEIAGSIRRKKDMVGDIEIVCIPKPYETGLFENGIATVINKFKKVKGTLPCKYTQRILPEGIKLDLFMVNADNWGNQLAMRTGSAEYSKTVLAYGWKKQGFTSMDGYLYRAGKKYNIETEKEFFELIKEEYVEPEIRNL